MRNGPKLLSRVIKVTGMFPRQAQYYAISILSRIASYIVEGVRYCEDMGIPAKKELKPNAIPTRFARPIAIPMVRVTGPHLHVKEWHMKSDSDKK